MYAIRLADTLGINLAEVLEEKLKLNESKYPVEQSHGVATKYTDF